jgi:hypothetical protein
MSGPSYVHCVLKPGSRDQRGRELRFLRSLLDAFKSIRNV